MQTSYKSAENMGSGVSKSFSEEVVEIFVAIFAFIKCSKLYLLAVAAISWFFSTYDVEGIAILFITSTFLDTLTRINTDAKNAGVPFNPFLMIFWRRIQSSGLKKMGRKIFIEYGVAILLAFMIDTIIFKNTLHFNLIGLKLDIPIFSILFFTGIEIWSIFENIEDGGNINWLKKGTKWFSSWLPEKWKKVYDKINEDSEKDEKQNKDQTQ